MHMLIWPLPNATMYRFNADRATLRYGGKAADAAPLFEGILPQVDIALILHI